MEPPAEKIGGEPNLEPPTVPGGDVIVLDTGPLGYVTHPRGGETAKRCAEWFRGLLVAGADIRLADICDYELRRELLRAEQVIGLQRLDALRAALEVLPVTSDVLARAATFWAEARRTGKPTAPDLALDGDVILAAQAAVLSEQSGRSVIIATTNVGHLARFVPARRWDEWG